MAFRTASTDVREDLGSQSSRNAKKYVLEGGAIPAEFASRTVFIPKSSDVDNNGFMVRSSDALRPSTFARFSPRRFAEAFIGTP